MKKGSDRKIMVILFTGVLMEALNIAIVVQAIPSIETALNVDPRVLGLIGAVFGLAFLVGPIIAQASDMSGYRNVFLYQALLLILILISAFFLKSHAEEKQDT